MKTDLSEFEIEQSELFIKQLCASYGQGLCQEECIEVGWLTYMEGRRLNRYDIADQNYWEKVKIDICESFGNLRRERNQRIRFTSPFALNGTSGD